MGVRSDPPARTLRVLAALWDQSSQCQPPQAQPRQAQPRQGQPRQGQPEQGQPEQGQPEQGQPGPWRHGYGLARRTGLGPGTLYPVLIGLADQGMIETCWQGSPRRHLYRLTATGQVAAWEALTAAQTRLLARALVASARRRGPARLDRPW